MQFKVYEWKEKDKKEKLLFMAKENVICNNKKT